MAVKKLIISSVVSLALVALPVLAFAQTPQFPHVFYGGVSINGSPAPSGTVVIAKVNGVEKGRVTTTVAGQYGGPGAYDQKLLVQGDIAPGATVIFSVDSHNAGQTASFTSEKVEKLDLTFNFETPPTPSTPSGGDTGGGGGGGGGSGGGLVARTADANRDGRVDILDFNLLMVNWGL